MPAITCWSRSAACSGRGSSSRSPRSSGACRPRLGSEPRERLLLRRARRARTSFTHAACLVPNSRSRSSRPSAIRTSSREVRSRGPARVSKSCRRPADIRCISSASSPPTSTMICLPRRRTPSIVRPASASSGGAKLFSVLIPGASADSIVAPRSAASSRRDGDLDLGQLGHRSRVRPDPGRNSRPRRRSSTA